MKIKKEIIPNVMNDGVVYIILENYSKKLTLRKIAI